METLILFVLRGEFGCNRIIDRFIEQDLKFESFGNLGLKYTLIVSQNDTGHGLPTSFITKSLFGGNFYICMIQWSHVN